jgi:hypothetical protein
MLRAIRARQTRTARSKAGFNARLCHLAKQMLGGRGAGGSSRRVAGSLGRARFLVRGRPVQPVPWHADASETDGVADRKRLMALRAAW